MQLVELEIDNTIELSPQQYSDTRHTLLDCDSIIFIACHGNEDKEHLGDAINVAISRIDEIFYLCNSAKNYICFSGKSYDYRNFRKIIEPSYKANRTTKPTLFGDVKDAVVKHYRNNGVGILWSDFVEADDLIYDYQKNIHSDVVIATIDKDIINNVMADCFNFKKYEHITPDKLLSEVFELKQALMGDATDNIKGIVGLGPKKVDSLFSPFIQRFNDGDYGLSYADLRQDLFSRVVLPNYVRQFGELQGYRECIKTMQLVSLRQYKNKTLMLWNESVFKLEKFIEQRNALLCVN